MCHGRFGKTIVIGCSIIAAAASNASAQCFEPGKHFRGGLWKNWIFQLRPGPSALAAIQRIEAEMNVARAAAGLPLLVFDPSEPIQISVFEEENPRGPDGANLANRLPNQEIALATFAELEGAFQGEVAVLLADPLRSNALLTAKGVPGVTAAFERKMKSEVEADRSETETHWMATTESDRITFRASYSSDAIAARARFPGTGTYLSCSVAHLLDVIFRSRPTETFQWFDRYQLAAVLDLARKDVEVSLNVRHHDPDVNQIFNDPANQALALGEYDRSVRIERQ
jgi:hypothetical protein